MSKKGRIARFEELDCWKEARVLTQLVYQSTRTRPFSTDFALRDQIRRASVSVMANIAEGLDCYSDQEFMRFLEYALRSCSEVRSHLYAALDQSYLSTEKFDEISKQCVACNNLIKALLKYLRTS